MKKNEEKNVLNNNILKFKNIEYTFHWISFLICYKKIYTIKSL